MLPLIKSRTNHFKHLIDYYKKQLILAKVLYTSLYVPSTITYIITIVYGYKVHILLSIVNILAHWYLCGLIVTLPKQIINCTNAFNYWNFNEKYYESIENSKLETIHNKYIQHMIDNLFSEKMPIFIWINFDGSVVNLI